MTVSFLDGFAEISTCTFQSVHAAWPSSEQRGLGVLGQERSRKNGNSAANFSEKFTDMYSKCIF